MKLLLLSVLPSLIFSFGMIVGAECFPPRTIIKTEVRTRVWEGPKDRSGIEIIPSERCWTPGQLCYHTPKLNRWLRWRYRVPPLLKPDPWFPDKNDYLDGLIREEFPENLMDCPDAAA